VSTWSNAAKRSRRELKVPLDLETRRSFVDLGNSKFSGAMEAIVRMQ
jgi:hypothetical protein